MSSGRKTVTLFLTVICALLLVIVGKCLGWPLWAWLTAAAALAAGPAAFAWISSRRKDPLPRELTLEPDLPIPPLERREQRIMRVALPSNTPDYDFILSATVRWHPIDAPSDAPVVNPGALATDAVLARARMITAQRAPGRSTLVQHELNGELGTMLPDPSGRVYAMAECVELMLSEQDRERLAKLSGVRKDEAVWEHERRYEQNKRAYLGGDVLKDTGSAVVWWLARNDDRIDTTVKDIGLLAQLSSAANNQDVPEPFRHLVPWPEEEQEDDGEVTATDLFDRMLLMMGFAEDDPERALFVDRVADAAQGAARHETAQAIRQRFDAQAEPGPDDEPPPPFGPSEQPPAP
ncbi:MULTISPECIES: hypothetical protein [Streptomyces]|uniref:hypothetical protein n=1 Tax=Streptomyces TaxID=1883 RepID=UPI00345B5EDC